MSTRGMHIETIRGMACIALVSMHVVGYTSQRGLELPSSDWLFQLQVMFADMRMPLFSFVSGVVFVAIPKPGQSWGSLILKKIRRLLIPMATVATVFWAVRAGMGYEQPALMWIYVFPFEHFWFLQATFVLMLTLLGINWAIRLLWPRYVYHGETAAFIGLCGAIFYTLGWGNSWVFFSINHALFLAVFFMTGQVFVLHSAGFSQFLARVGAARLWLCLLGVLALSAALAFKRVILPTGMLPALSLGIGVVTCVVLMGLRLQNQLLAKIGDKSYAIYLFHVFFTAGVTEALRYAAPEMDRHWFYLPALAAGLIGPSLVQAVILQSAWARWLFLGLKFPRRDPLPAQ